MNLRFWWTLLFVIFFATKVDIHLRNGFKTRKLSFLRKLPKNFVGDIFFRYNSISFYPWYMGTVFQASEMANEASVTMVNFSKMNLGDLYCPRCLHSTGHIEIWPLTARRLVTMAARTLQCTGTGSSLLQRQGKLKLFLPWEIKHFNLNLLLSY